MARMVVLSILLLSVGLLAACGAATTPDPVEGAFRNTMNGAPGWVLNCTSFVDDGVLCAVGSAEGTRNISLARSTAQGRGRTEIARQLELGVQAMLSDYQATVTGGEYFGTAADDEQMVVDVSRQITDISLSGVRQTETWVSNDGSTMFVLMELDGEAFGAALAGLEGLDAGVREYVEQNRADAFAEMDTLLEQQR
jgi:hypothetical protein